MQLKRNKHLHSKEHLLADDLSRAMLEEKKFAAYLGIARLYHEPDLRRLMRYVLEKPGLPREARGKYFFASLKGLPKKPSKHTSDNEFDELDQKILDSFKEINPKEDLVDKKKLPRGSWFVKSGKEKNSPNKQKKQNIINEKRNGNHFKHSKRTG